LRNQVIVHANGDFLHAMGMFRIRTCVCARNEGWRPMLWPAISEVRYCRKEVFATEGRRNLSRCAFGDLVLAIQIAPAGIRFTNNFQIINIIAASCQGDLREQFYQVFLGGCPSV